MVVVVVVVVERMVVELRRFFIDEAPRLSSALK
jgi:hypothetical protein